MAEGQALFDAIFVGGMDARRASQATAALGIFSLQQMPLAGARAQYLAAGGNFEALGHGLFSFNAFRTSHNCVFQKERAI